MKLLPAPLEISAPAFWRWGRLLLGAAFGFSLVLVLLLAWFAPEGLIVVSALVVGGAMTVFLFRRPLLNLGVVLAGMVLMVGHEAGFQLTEVLYGLYLVAFLGHWFVTRRLLFGERLWRTPEDGALLLFFGLVALSPVLTVLHGGRFTGVISEGFAWAMLGLYFPIREACQRHRHGLYVVLLALAVVGLFTAIRNFINYQEILLSASYAWQIAKGRAVTNDGLLMATSLTALVVLIFARPRGLRLALLAAFLVYFGALILTQSRGLWLAFLAGAGLLFLLVDRRHKLHLGLLALAGLTGFLTLGALFLGDYLMLILTSLGNRLASLGSAASSDLSLINRFYETRAVWGYIVDNPVLGYGMGVPYRYFDLTWDYTRVDTFAHNGYASLWFKFGIFGLGLMLFFWLRSVGRGIQVFRRAGAAPRLRVVALASAAVLLAFTVSALTSNPFFLSDTIFLFAIFTGLIAGVHARAALEPPAPAPA